MGLFEGFFLELELEDEVFDFGLGEDEFVGEVCVDLFCCFEIAGAVDPRGFGGEFNYELGSVELGRYGRWFCQSRL